MYVYFIGFCHDFGKQGSVPVILFSLFCCSSRKCEKQFFYVYIYVHFLGFCHDFDKQWGVTDIFCFLYSAVHHLYYSKGPYFYDVHKKLLIFRPLSLPPHPQKRTIDFLFHNNRIRKHVTNFWPPSVRTS
jgi:hypothetical protein